MRKCFEAFWTAGYRIMRYQQMASDINGINAPAGTSDSAELSVTGGKATVEELLMIAERAWARKNGPYIDHAELLYDDFGLPK